MQGLCSEAAADLNANNDEPAALGALDLMASRAALAARSGFCNCTLAKRELSETVRHTTCLTFAPVLGYLLCLSARNGCLERRCGIDRFSSSCADDLLLFCNFGRGASWLLDSLD